MERLRALVAVDDSGERTGNDDIPIRDEIDLVLDLS
jgi:hypothetical protein